LEQGGHLYGAASPSVYIPWLEIEITHRQREEPER
jgi:hypothetical protein